jgi:hypothetical protein
MAARSRSPGAPPAKGQQKQNMHQFNGTENAHSKLCSPAPHFAPAFALIFRDKESAKLHNFASLLICGKGINGRANCLKIKEMTFSDLS